MTAKKSVSAYGLPTDYSGISLLFSDGPGVLAITSVTPNHGPFTTHVVVVGAGFTHPGLHASLNLVAVDNFVVTSDTLLSFDVPNLIGIGTGSVDLAISYGGGPGQTVHTSFGWEAAGSVAVVSAVTYNYVDTAGGGQRIVVTVNSSTGCTAIKAGGVAFTGFAIDDATHVSGVPGAHAAGVVNVVVTNATGDSTTGTGLIEYWAPIQITGVGAVYDAEKGITGSPVTAWADQSAAALNTTAPVGREPVYTANAFGTIHGLTFNGTKRLSLAAESTTQDPWSCFFVAKWTSTKTTHVNYGGQASLVVLGDGTGGVRQGLGASAGQLEFIDAFNPGSPVDRGSGLNDGVARLCGFVAGTGATGVTAYVGTTVQGTTAATALHAPTWESIGAGYATGTDGDGFDGTIGAVVIVNGAIAGGDLTKLNAWSKQRFGTP